jgi:AcrR family transcriptional regulator
MEEREQRLREAARRVLSERGFDADIREILKLAEVGIGTAYRHFSNKQSLVRAVMDEMREQVADGLAGAARLPDARDAVARTMQVGFQALKDFGQLAIALFGGTEPDAYDSALDRVALERYFMALLRRGVEQGHFRADLDVEHAAGVWFALSAPSALRRLMIDGRSVDDIAALTTRFYTAAIGAAADRG